MAANVQAGDQDSRRQTRMTASSELETLKSEVNQLRRDVGDENRGATGWAKRCGVFAGLTATVITIILGAMQVVPALWPEQTNASIELDDLIFIGNSNGQLELRLNVTLTNEGKKLVSIPRPKVSICVDSADNVVGVRDNVHILPVVGVSPDGNGEAHLPIPLNEGGVGKIIWALRSDPCCPDWEMSTPSQPRRWHINLVFSPKGQQPITLEREFIFPMRESIQNLTAGTSKNVDLEPPGSYGDTITCQ
jgi:hypothetical protein